MYTVSFFGHQRMDSFSPTEEKLLSLLRRLSDREDHVEFLVGRDGDFDQLVASSVLRTKKGRSVQNSSLIWVMAYPKAEYANNEESFDAYYDRVEVCDEAARSHPKSAVQIRNRSIVDRSVLHRPPVQRSISDDAIRQEMRQRSNQSCQRGYLLIFPRIF